MCKVLPIKHSAEYFDLGWDAVKAIDRAYLETTLRERDLDGLTLLAMDEFAVHKGHRYATVVINPTCKRVLWVPIALEFPLHIHRTRNPYHARQTSCCAVWR